MATTQNINYPVTSSSGGGSSSTPNNAPIPSSSVLIAGENPAGNQQVVQTDSAGNLIVSPLASSSTVTVVQPTGTNLHSVIDSSALPTGASTSALQGTGNTSLASILADMTNGTQVTTLTGTVPLPTGAATSANQSTEIASLATIATNSGAQATSANQVAVQGTVAAGAAATKSELIGGVFNTTLPTLTTGQQAALQSDASGRLSLGTSAATIGSLTNISGTISLPTGASTSALQTTGNTSLSTIVTNTGLTATAAQQINGNQKTQISTPTALTIAQAAITVGTTAVRISPTGGVPGGTRVVLVCTPDAASTGKFYIGSSTVTSSGATRGIQIVAGQSFIANNDAGDYFIVSDTASQTVEVMTQG